MATTIQIGSDLLERLKLMKISEKESYEHIIWDLIEDTMELSEETKKNLKQSEKDIKEGRIFSLEEIKREFNLH